MSTIKEPVERKNNVSSLENRDYGRRVPLRWSRDTLLLTKVGITSPSRGGHSDGIVRSRTQAAEFVSLFSSSLSHHLDRKWARIRNRLPFASPYFYRSWWFLSHQSLRPISVSLKLFVSVGLKFNSLNLSLISETRVNFVSNHVQSHVFCVSSRHQGYLVPSCTGSPEQWLARRTDEEKYGKQKERRKTSK
jgi:hypothetical protein